MGTHSIINYRNITYTFCLYITVNNFIFSLNLPRTPMIKQHLEISTHSKINEKGEKVLRGKEGSSKDFVSSLINKSVKENNSKREYKDLKINNE